MIILFLEIVNIKFLNINSKKEGYFFALYKEESRANGMS